VHRRIHRRWWLGACLLCVALLPGCADPTIHPVGSARYDELPPETEVRVFKSETEIDEAYTVVGLLRETAVRKRTTMTLQDALPGLKQKARSVGANAIIVDATETATAGVSGLGVTVSARAVRLVESVPHAEP
jgi:hypothetical protein